ncbi:MAG: hypothetical protein K0A93_06370 [Desulfuromonadaceae bacterium]|nr:hypothetical protein [Desulfuromonadaceae bacterium]
MGRYPLPLTLSYGECDKISDEWLEVVKIDYRSVTVKDEYVDTFVHLSVGGGVGF